MRTSTPQLSVPYYSQWESPELVASFLADHALVSEDPNWRASGAKSATEYARWSSHICGMACLKMILESKTGETLGTMHLTHLALNYGAYIVKDEEIKGMIYQPCVDFLLKEFGVRSDVMVNFDTRGLSSVDSDVEYFIAPVHPSIRDIRNKPANKGGHLVLVTDCTEESITFHNPSGDSTLSQVDVTVSHKQFENFYAHRGIRVFADGNNDVP